MHDVIVIGAGIAGLTCARALTERGHRVLVLEKSRSFGGRCATRQWNGHIVDHGVSCFTISQPGFRNALELILTPNDLAELPNGSIVRRGQTHLAPVEGRQPAYYLRSGNNRLGKALAQTVDVRREHVVTSLGRRRTAHLVDDMPCRAVVLSAPWPQSAELLGLPDPPGGAIQYLPNLTAFFEYRGAFAGNSREAFARLDPGEHSALWWSACENHKQGRVRGDRSVFVVHASLEFTRKHLESPPTDYLPVLRQHLEHRWQLDGADLVDTFAHRWRYAFVREPRPQPPPLPEGVFLAGDACAGSQLEAVWTNGRQAADQVAGYLG